MTPGGRSTAVFVCIVTAAVGAVAAIVSSTRAARTEPCSSVEDTDRTQIDAAWWSGYAEGIRITTDQLSSRD